MSETFASTLHHAARPGASAGRADASRWRHGLATLRSMIAAWRERKRFRWQLKQMAKGNPHLIDDIGLTRRQVEAEVARLPFWQR